MKYKVLLCGKSKAIVDDFFTHLEMEFESQTTSLRYGDVMSHLRCFTPDVLIFCMHKEADDAISTISAFKSKLEYYNIPLVIIGNEEECEKFQKDTYRMAGLVLTKPILIRNIGEQVMKFLDNWKLEHGEMVTEEKETESIEKEVMQDKSLEKTSEKTLEKTSDKDDIPVKKHVLVVDDDPMMLKLIKEQLKDTYTVATAISGSLALKFLENKKTDMIILDYEMPGENGADVLKKIRDNEATSNLPVVFLTGITDRDKIQKVLSYKPQGYLLKPIEREKLLQIIASTLG